MLKTCITILLLLIQGGIAVFAQNYFVKSFGDTTKEEAGKAVFQMDDGSLYMAGFANIDSANKKDMTLHKLDAQGNILWARNYGTPQNDILKRAEYVADGGYFIMAGTRFTGGPDVADGWLAKVDTAGTLHWLKNFGTSLTSEQINGLAVTATGHFVLGGTYKDSTLTANNLLLIKTDTAGNELWNYHYGIVDTEEVGNAVAADDAGNIIIAGDRRKKNGEYQVIVKSVDSLGNELWQWVSPWLYNSGCKNIKQLNNGDWLITGETYGANGLPFGMYVIRLDPTGHLIWETLLDPNLGDHAYDVLEYGDSLLITGFGTNDVSTDLIVTAIDHQGVEYGERYLYGDALLETGYDIKLAQNGTSYFITGFDITGNDKQYMLIYDAFTLGQDYTPTPAGVAWAEKHVVKLYPNPVKAGSVLHYTFNRPHKFMLYNMMGKQVMHVDRRGQNITQQIALPSHLPAGLYHVVFISEKAYHRQQLIINGQ